jgi:hypothetical protein
MVPASINLAVCDLGGTLSERRLLFNADFTQVMGRMAVAAITGGHNEHVVAVAKAGTVVDYTAVAQRAGLTFTDQSHGVFDPATGHVFALGLGANRQSDHVVQMTADGSSVHDLGVAGQAASHGGFARVFAESLGAQPAPDGNAAVAIASGRLMVTTGGESTGVGARGALPFTSCRDLIWLAGRRLLCTSGDGRAAVLKFDPAWRAFSTAPFLPSVRNMSFPSAVASQDGNSVAFIAYNRTDRIMLYTVDDPSSSNAVHVTDLPQTTDPRDYFLIGWYGPSK